MITIPKDVCSSCPVNIEQQLYDIPPILDCDCPDTPVMSIVEVIDPLQFCPCPIEQPIIHHLITNPTPTPIKNNINCFENFIKNITSTKFCQVGPTCRVS